MPNGIAGEVFLCAVILREVGEGDEDHGLVEAEVCVSNLSRLAVNGVVETELPMDNGMAAPSSNGIEVSKWEWKLSHSTKEVAKIKITTIGLDLAKNVFRVHGVDESGKTVLKMG